MELHHIGLVVGDIVAAADEFRRFHGGDEIWGPIVDDIQLAEIALVRSGDGLLYELLRPVSDESPIARAAKRGGPLHHLCFAVSDVEGAIADARERAGIVVMPPAPAAAFGGLPVAFVYYRHRGLVEYVDRRATSPYCVGTSEGR